MSAGFSLVTWNVNSVRARLDNILTYLDEREPDVACLQEVKVEEKLFPRVPFMELGYEVHLNCSKGYAGVATLTRQPATDVQKGFADPPEDPHRRILALTVHQVRIYNLYVPNGTEYGSEAFAYKLDWLRRLRAELDAHRVGESVLLCGDFNVVPEARDVWDVEGLRRRTSTHYTDEEHEALREVLGFGLRDCFRKHEAEGGQFTFFDYQWSSWEARHGMRIDHVYATDALYARSQEVVHDLEPREWDSPSDHVPVFARFSAPA